jgi:hypothetical protein
LHFITTPIFVLYYTISQENIHQSSADESGHN